MRFNRNAPKENSKRVEGMIISMSTISGISRRNKPYDIFAVQIEHSTLGIKTRKVYGTSNPAIATTCATFLYEGMHCYLTIVDDEIVGCGALK